MGTRDYQFINGPETPTLPTATGPSAPSDLVTLSYAQANFMALLGVETQFVIANNQSSPANITGLIFDHNTYRSIEVQYTLERRTSTQGYRQTGRLICTYEAFAGAWTVDNIADSGASGMDTGVEFSIDASTGQLKYVSDDTTGSSYIGKMRHKVVNGFLKET